MPRAVYIPESVDFWQHQVLQTGGAAFTVFAGTPHQRGAGIGSFFRSLWRGIVPLIRHPIVGKVGKAIAKQAAISGASLLSDVVKGEKIKPALEARGREAVSQLAEAAAESLKNKDMMGSGIGQLAIPPRRARVARRRKSTTKKRKVKRHRRTTQSGSGRRRKGKRKRKTAVKKGRKRARRSSKFKDIFG
jgi:hypothetical protein